MPVVSDIADMYRAVDGGAMSAFLARLGAERTLSARLQAGGFSFGQKTVSYEFNMDEMGGPSLPRGFGSSNRESARYEKALA